MTSVLNSATSAAHPTQKTEKVSHSKASGLSTAGEDGEFGALFGAMMGGLEGQNIAAPEGKASPPIVGLAAQVLGPAVHIITASTPALSDESLYAFARSQGMDEDALALIFQKPASASESAPGLQAAVGDADLAVKQSELTLSKPSPLTFPQAAADRLAMALTPAEKATASVLSQPTPASTPPRTESIQLGEDATLRWTLGKAADALPTAQSETPQTPQSNLFGLNGVRNLMPSTPPVQVAPVDPAAHPESAHQNLAASLILGASEAAQFARRLELKQASQRAERVAPGSLPPTALGAGPTMPSDLALLPDEMKIAAVETLVVAPEIAPEDMAEILAGRAHGTEGRTHSMNSSAPASEASSPTPRPDQTQRAEQYERLSQRLGEALGQRLAAQIAKGDWRVDLALKPHELGNIDIELKMKEGALQANFNAGQAMTRDLIADSLPRLKEVLSQLGMDVANMDVNVRQNSQHGGNPTPGRSSSGSGSQAGKGKTETVSEVSTSMATRNVSKGPDGLDVLV